LTPRFILKKQTLLGYKSFAAAHKSLRSEPTNYFQGLKIYYQALEIYFHGLKKYYQTLKIII